MRTLDEVDASCAQLLARYELLAQQKQLADEELQCAKELVTYVKVTSYETRKFVIEDRKFHFAAEYREWYDEITSGLELSAESTVLDSTQSHLHTKCAIMIHAFNVNGESSGFRVARRCPVRHRRIE